MRHIIFEKAESYPIAILIKESAFNQYAIENSYLKSLLGRGITKDQVLAMSLAYDQQDKAPAKLIFEYLESLLPALDSVGVKYLYCADAEYFKKLTKQTKAEPFLGYVLPCAIDGYTHMKVVLGVNHRSLLYNPANEPKLIMSLNTLADEFVGSYTPPGKQIIHAASYPDTLEGIQTILEAISLYPALTCDIETFSLDFSRAGIGTITFCWNQHEGVAFAVDYKNLDEPVDGYYGEQFDNQPVKAMLRKFFESYRGKLVFHNSPFDTKVLIYELWMKDLLDTKGLLEGLHCLYRDLDDTKIIAYLATNSCAGNKLGLKDLAHEFAGYYAQDEIKDIRRIPLPQLLEYNLVDGLCTWFVYNKYRPIMVQDQQESLYKDLMIPSQKVITQVELTGLPLDPIAVQSAKQELEAIIRTHLHVLENQPSIKKVENILTQRAWEKDYQDRKSKAKNPDKIMPKDRNLFPKVVFNPNSNPQVQVLLYEVLGLPVIDLTEGKQPATGGDTLEKLKNHTKDPEALSIIEALQGFADASKILSTFIPAFERAIEKGDGVVWLHGSFNLGGTKSGRLSSSDPNLQNIPAGSTYGKLIKSCFKAPKGRLFCGADFNSLEDYISALTTKDPNKLKVYLEGYDGHCLRAFSYFPERLPGIVNTVESINSIKELFPEVRQASKAPTFALTYQGTWRTLVNNLGFDPEVAKQIESNYHELYKVSDQWVQAKLDQAAIDGYVTLAFGLRLRTPLLSQTLRNHKSTPYEAQAEGRTAGNALGQSYGLLTNRALNAFMDRVWNSRFKYDVWPVAMIHDAIYLVIKDDIDVVEWVNRELIEAMRWQELPEIQHDTVKIGAALDIFYPSWASPVTLPNDATKEEIRAICTAFLAKLAEKKKEKLVA